MHCFALRSDKKLIADMLPKKTDRIVLCKMSVLQKTCHARIMACREVQFLRDSAKACTGAPNCVKLWKCCHGKDEFLALYPNMDFKDVMFRYLSKLGTAGRPLNVGLF